MLFWFSIIYSKKVCFNLILIFIGYKLMILSHLNIIWFSFYSADLFRIWIT